MAGNDRRLLGQEVLWCEDCGRYFRVKRKEDGSPLLMCPVCERPPLNRRCYRCHHTWTPHDRSGIQYQCPRCKSPYWARLRLREGGR